jgi:hypothetical protein
MAETIQYEKNDIEYIRDPITGKRKPLLTVLNKKELSRKEMDELFIEHE